jgi:hypothetical protein
MIDPPASHRQFDLLVPAANVLEPNRIPRATRAEVTALLTLLMAEHIAAGLVLSSEAADE